MFKRHLNLDDIRKFSQNTMVDHLGIEFLGIGEDYITARMPVDHRTVQPYRILHGGASVVLAETLGSIAADASVEDDRFTCVGLEINANHIRPVREGQGYVYGTARAHHIGKSTQVWEIKINDEQQRLVCISRITMAVVEKR
jgi:1,4-dihydroxy-2-naphthoyl-CoA hydrolase